jgi:hypothetical protein
MEIKAEEDRPCLYQFGEWSKCPVECTKDGHRGYKERTVKANTIVQARGVYAKYSPCPENLATLKETIPCNTHACPKNLSEFPFPKNPTDNCWAIDPFDPASKCYQIREIPFTDQAVSIF